jgi:CHAP domain
MNGVPWCNIFVSYCFSVGAHYTIAAGFHGAGCSPRGCAYVPTTEAWLRATGLWLGRVDPEPGDIAIYNWDGGPPDHIGIVESGGDGAFTAIEGNTAVGADSNGGEVLRRRRTLDDVDGFGRVHSSRTSSVPRSQRTTVPS